MTDTAIKNDTPASAEPHCSRGDLRIDFMWLRGPLVVTFRGEGAQCRILDTPEDVIHFLMSEEHGAGFENDWTLDELLAELQDADNWTFDEGNEAFEFRMGIGEISDLAVTRVSVP